MMNEPLVVRSHNFGEGIRDADESEQGWRRRAWRKESRRAVRSGAGRCRMGRERGADRGKAGGRRSSRGACERNGAGDRRRWVRSVLPALPWPFVPPHMQPSCVLSLRAAFSLLPVAGEAKSALSAHLSSLHPPCAGTLCPPVRKNVRFLATKPRSGTMAARFRFKSAPLHSESPGKRFRQARCVFKTSLIRARTRFRGQKSADRLHAECVWLSLGLRAGAGVRDRACSLRWGAR